MWESLTSEIYIINTSEVIKGSRRMSVIGHRCKMSHLLACACVSACVRACEQVCHYYIALPYITLRVSVRVQVRYVERICCCSFVQLEQHRKMKEKKNPRSMFSIRIYSPFVVGITSLQLFPLIDVTVLNTLDTPC